MVKVTSTDSTESSLEWWSNVGKQFAPQIDDSKLAQYSGQPGFDKVNIVLVESKESKGCGVSSAETHNFMTKICKIHLTQQGESIKDKASNGKCYQIALLVGRVEPPQ